MQRNGKLSSINQRAGGGGGGGKQQKLPGNVTTCWIYQKNFKITFINMFTKLKEAIVLKLKKGIMKMLQQRPKKR